MEKKTITVAMALLLALTLTVATVFDVIGGNVNLNTLVSVSASDDIVINEIMFDPVGDDAGSEWIELYNNGTQPQNTDGWTISNRTGETVAMLPSWNFPNGTYLVVYFGVGTNDDDFSDGSGSFYTGNVVEVFVNTEDEVALFSGAPNASTIADFVSYCFDGEYNPGVAHDYAISAGIWDSGDFFSAHARTHFITFPIISGDTIGRDKDSTDTNQPEDWDGHGGVDAQGPTPGARNIHSFTITPPPPPPPPPWPQPHKNWTVMVYMDGDGVLEIPWINDINKMELAGSDDNVNIVVQINLLRNFGGKTYRSYIQKDTNLNNWDSPKITVEPKPDMGAPEALSDFINWSTTNFPALHYALFIAGHGQGWKGTLIHEAEGRGLRMWELSAALSPALILDTVVFYSCLMGTIEVAYQIYDYAMTMVASEETTYAVFPFDTFLTSLKQNPTWDAETFAKQATVQFDAALATYGIGARTTSAIRLGGPLLDLVAKVSDFADDMLGDTAQTEWGLEDYDFRFKVHHNPRDNVQMSIKNDRAATESYSDSSFIDLYDFMGHVDTDGSIPPEYKGQAPLIKAALVKDAGVIMEEKHGPNHPRSHGLSIYFPIDQSVSQYAFDKPSPSRFDGAFSSLAIYAEDKTKEWGLVPDDHPYPETPNFNFRDKSWDEFLHRYYKPVADAGRDRSITGYYSSEKGEFGANVILDGSGSSDSDGLITMYIWDLKVAVSTDDDDWDRDGVVETDDDNDASGPTPTVWLPLGVTKITLTVWDDHYLRHSNHWKTDQDSLIVNITLQVGTSDSVGDLIYIDTGEPVGEEKEYFGYVDVELVHLELKGEARKLDCTITVGGEPQDYEVVIDYTLMVDVNNDHEDNCPDYPYVGVDTMYTVKYTQWDGWWIERAKYLVEGGWFVEDTDAWFGLASSFPGGFSIDISIPLTELSYLTGTLPWKVSATAATLMFPALGDFVPDEGLVYLGGFQSDINKDGVVDIFDVVLAAIAFGSEPGDENWNQAADLNNNDIVDIFDIVLLAKNFGATA